MDELESEPDFQIPNFDSENLLMNFIIDLHTGKVEDWKRDDFLRIWGKIRDEGTYTLLDAAHTPITQITGYVPNRLLPPFEQGWGDYLELAIQPDGTIDNWSTTPDFSEFLEKGHAPCHVRTNKYRKATEALLSLYRYHLTDDEKQWIARQLTTDMEDLRKSELIEAPE
ncbi:MAG: hypothetical protein KBT12_09005 [Bacteroidales bacterium]|nr:hypothetical protein [Candidatus Physcousia equi]